MNKKKLNFITLMPIISFALIGWFLWSGLHLHPEKIPSPLIQQLSPKFSLPTLIRPNDRLTEKIFKNHITLLNVWSSNCIACFAEHRMLMALAGEKKFNLIGLNYHDNTTAAKNWLKKFGNPYREIIVDTKGNTSIDLGIYGTPETFIIDKKGIIRYRQVGAITPNIWQNIFKPMINNLENES